MDTSEYLGLFLDESGESLQALNASLLDLEREPGDPEPLTVIFRVAHSLKGMSATMGFEAMARLTHRMEEVLAAMRDDGAPVTPAVSDALFACLDTLQEMVDRVAASDPEEVDASAVMARLDAIAAGEAGAPAEAVAAVAEVAATLAPERPALTDYERMVVAEAHERGLDVLRVDVAFDEGCQLVAARAFMVVQELEGLGDLIRSDPPTDEIEAGDAAADGVAFWVVTSAEADEVQAAALGVSEVASVEVTPVEDDSPSADAGEPEAAAAETAAAVAAPPRPAAAPSEGRTAPRAAATVRVGTDRLDQLMNLMGEMVIQRTRLVQLAQEHDLADLRGAVEDVSRVTNDLQTLIMQVRMMPVEAVFMRFPRMVRDLANTLGKRLDLVITGEDTELDRTIIDGLGDPLVHMLRNAVDHGLESPEERVAAGKEPVGTVHLTARHAGNHVVIEVRDDGKGMDPDALRASVVRKGLMTEDAAAALSDEQALDLVFLPGFSTAATTTDVSGRGVGMDAVRTAIADLNGEISISSAPGRGSAFTIRIPLTLAIIQALLVSSGAGRGGDGPRQVYAVPLEAIEETVIVDRSQAKPVNGRPCLVLRDQIVPLVWLSECLSLDASAGEDENRLDVVVVTVGPARLGLVVDGLVGKQDVVIKHLPDYLGDVPGVAGATIMGDGSVALIVDVAAVASAAGMLP